MAYCDNGRQAEPGVVRAIVHMLDHLADDYPAVLLMSDARMATLQQELEVVLEKSVGRRGATP